MFITYWTILPVFMTCLPSLHACERDGLASNSGCVTSTHIHSLWLDSHGLIFHSISLVCMLCLTMRILIIVFVVLAGLLTIHAAFVVACWQWPKIMGKGFDQASLFCLEVQTAQSAYKILVRMSGSTSKKL